MTEETKEVKTEEKKIASVADYRKKAGAEQLITLPSGAVFKVKKLSVMDYLENGLEEIPNDFLQYIEDMQSGKTKQMTPEEQIETLKKNTGFFEKYLEVSINVGVIEPKIILKYDKDKVGECLIFSELTEADQVCLIDVITGRVNGEPI